PPDLGPVAGRRHARGGRKLVANRRDGVVVGPDGRRPRPPGDGTEVYDGERAAGEVRTSGAGDRRQVAADLPGGPGDGQGGAGADGRDASPWSRRPGQQAPVRVVVKLPVVGDERRHGRQRRRGRTSLTGTGPCPAHRDDRQRRAAARGGPGGQGASAGVKGEAAIGRAGQ